MGKVIYNNKIDSFFCLCGFLRAYGEKQVIIGKVLYGGVKYLL